MNRISIKRDIVGEIIFWLTTVFGIILYFFSAPSGLPWSGSTKLALAWAGQIAPLPEMPHPVWGYFIQVFGGHFITLSGVTVALAGGLIGAITNRYLGWRLATAAALTWITAPAVWYRAIIGAHGTFWTFSIVLMLWLANVVFLFATRRARKVASEQQLENQNVLLTGAKTATWRTKVNRLFAWTILGLAVVAALLSLTLHDYTTGEAASVYAQQMLEEAGDRLVILNTIADDQMVWEAERREKGSSARLVTLRNDEEYIKRFVAQVRQDWPTETNLWAAAEVNPQVFADLAIRKHPDRVFVMTGLSTTPEKWAARWEAMKPYLKSRDAFLFAMRRAFAFEANTLGNRLQKDGKLVEAWKLYWRILEEVDPANTSALVNLSEMIRRGYKAEASKRRQIETEMIKLFQILKNDKIAERAAAITAACGPVMADSKVLAEYRAEIVRRLNEIKAKKRDEQWQMPAELRSLIDWNNEMLKARDSLDYKTAARLARQILSRREWSDSLPANAVMGAAMAHEGDYEMSALFYRAAVGNAAKPPAPVCNDYADTLLHLGRLAEAEEYARIAVGQTDEKVWLFRLTLAQILKKAGGNEKEVEKLIAGVFRHAPVEMRDRIRKDFADVR